MSRGPPISSGEPSSAEEWHQWLSTREEEKRNLYLSPKRLSQKLLVGEKGLGFRSILN